LDGDGGKIERRVIGDWLQPVVVKRDLHIRRGQSGDYGRTEGFHARSVQEQAVSLAADVRID
jgi:hypothetical protein